MARISELSLINYDTPTDPAVSLMLHSIWQNIDDNCRVGTEGEHMSRDMKEKNKQQND